MVISIASLAGLRAWLRPSFLRRRLEQHLPLHTAAGAALVDWRWDCVNKFELRAAIVQIRPLG